MSTMFDGLEPAFPTPPTADAPHLEIVAIGDVRSCEATTHVGAVYLADDSRVSAPDAMAMLDAGRVFFMRPPPGAWAHDACEATGAKLLLQVRECEHCGERVLFA